MKILLFILLAFSLYSQQTVSNGCFKEINVPAEFIDDIETIIIDEVSYDKPIIKDIDKKILIKDKAIEEYYELDQNKVLTKCVRIIDAIYETIKVPTIFGSEKVIVRKHEVIIKQIKKKVRDGYISIVPCDKIINSIK